MIDRKYCIMMVGRSHSGKSTLAHNIKDYYVSKDFSILDNDTIRSMVKDYYPDMFHASWDKQYLFEKTRRPLISKLQFAFLQHLVEFNQHLILSNANSYKELRDYYTNYLRENGYIVIIIFVNTDRNTVIQRLQKSQKDMSLLRTVEDYMQAYDKQQERFTPPSVEEADYIIEYDGIDTAGVLYTLDKIFV